MVGRGEVWCCAVREEVGEGSGHAGDEDEDGTGEGGKNGNGSSEEVQGRWVILTGSGDGEAKIWVVEKDGLARGMAENVNGEVSSVY